MAELHVEKKKSSPWLWVILGIIALGIILFLVFRNNKDTDDNLLDNKSDTGVTIQTTTGAVAPTAVGTWEGIDYNSPKTSFEELNII